MLEKKPKVLVGISGGVDSAVAALLLQKKGYEVEGLFIDFIGNNKSKKDFLSAKKIAKKLNIKIYKIDAQKEFQKKIIDEFVADYEQGITPNPCVFCNPEMKFRILIEEADKRGIKFVATGHYARVMGYKTWSIKHGAQDVIHKIQDTNKIQTSNLKLKIKNYNRDPRIREDDNFAGLFKARDESKDQSYFLYRLTQEQLKRVIFPLENYLKVEVREIAQENNFEIENKEESQDVCFIENNDFSKFIRTKIINKPGKIVDKKGKILGEHTGLHFYTIGQRKGINLGGDGPYFVIKKDLKNNNLIVSNSIKDLLRKEFEVVDVNWIGSNLIFPLEAMVKIRYQAEEVCAIIKKTDAKKSGKAKVYKVILSKFQKSITSGQSAVFYSKKGEVLGGGIII